VAKNFKNQLLVIVINNSR